MSYFSRVFKFWRSNAIEQRKGRQDNAPILSAHEDSPSVGVDSSLQVSSVWACVTLIVENIASLPLFVYDTDEKGERRMAKNTRIYRILHDKPNERQTAFEFWEQMLLNYVLRGNAYARIGRDARGEAISLWPLASDQVEVIVDDDGSLVYEYQYGEKSLTYNESEILHIRGMGNGIVGMSPLEYMRSSVKVATSAQNHTSYVFRRKGRRPGIMTSQVDLKQDQREKLKNDFSDIVKGTNEELYLLAAWLKFEPLGMSPADIQLLETRRFSVQDIARWFGVPSILINDNAESSTLGSSAQQIIESFHKLKLRPFLERIEQRINKSVFTTEQISKGMIAEFNDGALLRMSLADRMEVMAKGVQNGIYKRSDCRKWENLEFVEGSDKLTAQTNLAPLDKLGDLSKQTGNVPADPIRQ